MKNWLARVKKNNPPRAKIFM